MDTVRADHLSLDGYPRPTSPRLEEWAGEGVYFERFYAHSSWTRPSVATLLSGWLPTSHGIFDSSHALGENVPYLPERLRSLGYETAAIVANPQIHSQLGFARGFDHFEELFADSVKAQNIRPADLITAASAEKVFAVAQERLAELEGPFFVYLHVIDPHGPYTPPAAFARRFTDPDYGGSVTGRIEDFIALQTKGGAPEDLAQFTALYDAEIAATDAALGDFLDWLDVQGFLDRTHIVITADHGEELLEHGGTGHGRKIFEEQVRIPLLWKGPGVPRGWRTSVIAGLVDIAPTMMRLARGSPAGDADERGWTLQEVWSDAPSPRPRSLLFEELAGARQAGGGGPLVVRGIVLRSVKAIAPARPVAAFECEGPLAVYDLESDPAEQRPMELPCASGGIAHAEAATIFRERLDLVARAPRFSAPGARLPEEAREQLRALGYFDG